MDSSRSVSFPVHMESSPKLRYHHVRYLPILKLPARSSEGQGMPRYLKTNAENVEVGKKVNSPTKWRLSSSAYGLESFKCSTPRPLCGCGVFDREFVKFLFSKSISRKFRPVKFKHHTVYCNLNLLFRWLYKHR